MKVEEYNLGETLWLDVTGLTEPNSTTLIDWTGYSAFGALAVPGTTSWAAAALTGTDSDGRVVFVDDGHLRLVFGDTETEGLAAGRYIPWVKIKSAGGHERTLEGDLFKLKTNPLVDR